jgi:hypothetical protein
MRLIDNRCVWNIELLQPQEPLALYGYSFALLLVFLLVR